jgi:signal transduction histidine kinase/CheY-like chemotaxis protein
MKLARARVPIPARGAKRWLYGLGPLGLAVGLRLLLEPVLAGKSPFLLLTVAVMVGTVYGGLVVGLTATALGAAAGLFFLAEGTTLQGALGEGRSVQLSLYLLCCCGITAFLEMVRQYRIRTEKFAEEQGRLAEELARANRLKDEFLATLSHELRTPLSAIVGWSDLLIKGGLAPEGVERAVETIHRNARIQVQLISDLLDLSSITSGKTRLQPRVVNAHEIASAAADTLRPAAQAKQIDLSVRFGGSAPVWADPDRLHQVVWNLLSNAVKFTPRHGQVVVSVSVEGNQTRIKVEDTGPGIRPDFLGHVFDRFRQDNSSRTRVHGGLGLGLAIVKHLVELHGGTVRADNRTDGTGAVFEVILPRLDAARSDTDTQRAAADAAPRRQGQPLSGVRVLIVDDDADFRAIVQSALAGRGAEVAAAESVGAAMKSISERRPDVVLTDIAMPEEDGYDLLRCVESVTGGRPGFIHTVAVSAYATAPERARALEAGFEMHLAKPVDADDLTQAIESLVGRH